MRAPAVQHANRLIACTAVLVLASSGGAFGAAAGGASGPTLVVDNSFLIDTADPQRAFDPTSTIVDRARFDTLFTYNGKDVAKPVPSLVATWRMTPDAKSFTFRLKQNVRFADGSPLTSADVVFSLRRLINLKGNPSFLLDGVNVSASGRYTVAMVSTRSVPQLPSILANISTGVVNSRLVRAHGGTDAPAASTADKAERWFNSPASIGVGSGPYALESYSRTSKITLLPNPRYWGPKKPGFGRIVLRNAIAPVQLLDIQRGSHEIAIDLSAAQAQTLRARKRLHVSLQPSPWVFYLFANDDPGVSATTSNKQFQLAVRGAVDYEGLRALAGPGAIQAPGLIPSMIPGALRRKDAMKQDLAKARASLAASGVADHQVTLEYPSDLTVSGLSFATLAQRVQSDLERAGFRVALSGSPATQWQPRFRAGHVAFGLWVWGPDYPDPVDYLVFTPGQLVALHAGWPSGSDPALEQLVSKALVATKPEARAGLYREIQLALNARSPFVPLIQPAQAFVSTSDLAGAAFSGAYDLDLTRVSATG